MEVVLIILGLLVGVVVVVKVAMPKDPPERQVDCSSSSQLNRNKQSDPKPEPDLTPRPLQRDPHRKPEQKSQPKPAQESQPKPEPEQADPKETGNRFEDFVADIFHANKLRIKEWNKGSVTSGGAFAENALNPDMFIIDGIGEPVIEYWAECKFRSVIPDYGFSLKEYQVKRYSEIQRSSKRKILILLGVGGSPSRPEHFYVIPLDDLVKFKHIPQKYLDQYVCENPEYALRHRIRHYFLNTVFKKYRK